MLQARSSAAVKGPFAMTNRIRPPDDHAPNRATPHQDDDAGLPPTVERSADSEGAVPHFQLWQPDAGEPGQDPPHPPEQQVGSTRPILHPSDTEQEPYFPEVGMLIAGFALVEELGRGSSARVFLARERILCDRRVILKVCRPVGAEAEALSLLSHPNVVPIYSVREMPSHGLRLICMPFVPGRSLSEILEARGWERPPLSARRPCNPAVRLRRDGAHAGHPAVGPTSTEPLGRSRFRAALGRMRSSWTRASRRHVAHEAEVIARGPHVRPVRFEPMGVNQALDLVIPLADALVHSHANGVLHRDVKPSNVIVTEEGRPVLIDFHLATLPRELSEGDRSALLGGTLTYMAPEHIRAFNPIGGGSPSDVDERSDLYGLGLVLYEVLAGRPAFQEPPLGMPTTQRLIRMAEMRRISPPPSPRAENSAVPSRLDAVVRKCLEPDPARRYRSAAEFRDELIRIREHRRLRHTAEPCQFELGLALAKNLGRPFRKTDSVAAGLALGIALATTASGAIASLWR